MTWKNEKREGRAERKKENGGGKREREIRERGGKKMTGLYLSPVLLDPTKGRKREFERVRESSRERERESDVKSESLFLALTDRCLAF